MRTIVRVNIWGMTAGVAHWDEKIRCARFQYNPAFAEKGIEIAPIMMPLSENIYSFESAGRYAFKGLPGMLADSLPDKYGNTLIDMWIRRNGMDINRFTSLDRLCYVGSRSVGALEYEPATKRGAEAERIDVDLLSALAAEAVKEREDVCVNLSEEGIDELISIGTSAGGARAKAVIALDETAGEIISGQLHHSERYTDWIIKFDTEGDLKRGFCRVEHAYYRMAAECGIDMSQCRLLETKGGTHFMTRRFDRNGKEKVHVQTLNAMAHYDFTIPAAHSYEQLFSVMRKIKLPAADADEMFRRTAFNIVMRNNDDHTKNISFMLRKGEGWRLAPAYDVTYAYKPGNMWIQAHQMTVNGKTDGITKKDLLALAHNANIRGAGDKIEAILNVACRWKEYAKESSVPDATAEKIGASLEENEALFTSLQ
ncbi:MAG: type II toxin-antitoxin system HipA family toxin [Methanomassiliicoccaceae archaeon]|nr:type II toxin-antitoxin system HipA family toxin [Methanomassiliicoccaceae archaeon]